MNLTRPSTILAFLLVCCSLLQIQQTQAQCTPAPNQAVLEVTINTGSGASEVYWQVTHALNGVIESVPAGTYITNNTTFGPTYIPNHQFCVDTGEVYTFEAQDSFADGWNGGSFSISCGGSVIATGVPILPGTTSMSLNFTACQPCFNVAHTTTDVTCQGGNDGSASLTVLGGTAPYSVSWSSGDTGTVVNSLAAGTWFYTVTDGSGCAVTGSAVVNQPANPAPSLSASITNFACLSINTGAIDLTVSGGTPPFSYNWSNGQTTEDISSLVAGSYSVQLVDSTGCTLLDTFQVDTLHPLLSLTVPYTDPSCTGLSDGTASAAALGGNTPYIYEWSTGVVGVPGISMLAAGTYTVTVTDNLGCVLEQSVTLVDKDTILAGTITQNGGTALANSTVFLIDHNSSAGSLTALATTTTDAAGYYEFEVHQTDVYVKAAPDSTTYPNEIPTYYDNEFLFANATVNNFTSCDTIFADFATLAGANPGGPGFIGGLISQGANKTEGVGDPVPDLDIFLVNATDQAVAHATTAADGSFSFPNLAFGNYEVWVDDLTTRNEIAPTAMVSAELPVRDQLLFRLHSDYLEFFGTVGVGEQAADQNQLSVLPNPADGLFRIQATQPIQEGKIVNLLGKVVWNLTDPGQQNITVDLSALPAGTYLLRAKDAERVYTQKVVLK